MKTSRLVLMAAAGAAGLASAPLTMAAGFQLNEHSVSGIGRAYAGEAAMADNASTIARNPAVMALMKDREISVVLHHIDPDVDVDGTYRSTITNTVGPISADAKDIAPEATIPGLYFVDPGEKFSWGIMANSYFGLSTDYGEDYVASELANKTSVETYSLSVPMSYRFHESFSAGLTLSFIHGEGELNNVASPALFATTNALGVNLPVGTTMLNMEGDGNAFGWQLGALWEIDENHRLGFRYQAAVDLDLEGDMQVFESSAGRTVTYREGTLTVALPDGIEIAYVGQVTEYWTILASVVRTGWSSFENLTAEFDGFDLNGNSSRVLKEENWEDAYRYSVGFELKATENLTSRFGYGYDESPVKPEYRTLTIPDADRQWLAWGLTYSPKASKSSLDLAILYIVGDQVEVTEGFESSGVELTEFNGRLSSTNAIIYSMGYNYRF